MDSSLYFRFIRQWINSRGCNKLDLICCFIKLAENSKLWIVLEFKREQSNRVGGAHGGEGVPVSRIIGNCQTVIDLLKHIRVVIVEMDYLGFVIRVNEARQRLNWLFRTHCTWNGVKAKINREGQGWSKNSIWLCKLDNSHIHRLRQCYALWNIIVDQNYSLVGQLDDAAFWTTRELTRSQSVYVFKCGIVHLPVLIGGHHVVPIILVAKLMLYSI